MSEKPSGQQSKAEFEKSRTLPPPPLAGRPEGEAELSELKGPGRLQQLKQAGLPRRNWIDEGGTTRAREQSPGFSFPPAPPLARIPYCPKPARSQLPPEPGKTWPQGVCPSAIQSKAGEGLTANWPRTSTGTPAGLHNLPGLETSKRNRDQLLMKGKHRDRSPGRSDQSWPGEEAWERV